MLKILCPNCNRENSFQSRSNIPSECSFCFDSFDYIFTVDHSRTCCKNVFEHVGLLVKFALFNIILPSSDFITDILTAQSFFQRGHFYWGFCTMLFVFLPFLGRLAMFLWSIVKLPLISLNYLLFKKAEDEFYPNKMTELQVICRGSLELIWHFPPLIIFRSV